VATPERNVSLRSLPFTERSPDLAICREDRGHDDTERDEDGHPGRPALPLDRLAVSKLGVQRALGLAECATPPEEVYALAKRRGMDFVTITDHDTIDGALEIADRPDVFVSRS
jgi:hypothetical protein